MDNRFLAIKNKIQKLLDENAEYRLNINNLKLELEKLQSQNENFDGNKVETNSQDFSSDEIESLNSQLERKQALIEESDNQMRELKIRISELEEENLLKENTLEIQKNTINDLKEQNKLIKLANEMSDEKADNHDLKIKINELIRDIDRCIDLLNE